MNRAKEFVEGVSKGLDIARNNKPKGLVVFVYVYARDPDNKDEDHPDGQIEIHRTAFISRFDEYFMKQDLDGFFKS